MSDIDRYDYNFLCLNYIYKLYDGLSAAYCLWVQFAPKMYHENKSDIKEMINFMFEKYPAQCQELLLDMLNSLKIFDGQVFGSLYNTILPHFKSHTGLKTQLHVVMDFLNGSINEHFMGENNFY